MSTAVEVEEDNEADVAVIYDVSEFSSEPFERPPSPTLQSLTPPPQFTVALPERQDSLPLARERLAKSQSPDSPWPLKPTAVRPCFRNFSAPSTSARAKKQNPEERRYQEVVQSDPRPLSPEPAHTRGESVVDGSDTRTPREQLLLGPRIRRMPSFHWSQSLHLDDSEYRPSPAPSFGPEYGNRLIMVIALTVIGVISTACAATTIAEQVGQGGHVQAGTVVWLLLSIGWVILFGCISIVVNGKRQRFRGTQDVLAEEGRASRAAGHRAPTPHPALPGFAASAEEIELDDLRPAGHRRISDHETRPEIDHDSDHAYPVAPVARHRPSCQTIRKPSSQVPLTKHEFVAGTDRIPSDGSTATGARSATEPHDVMGPVPAIPPRLGTSVINTNSEAGPSNSTAVKISEHGRVIYRADSFDIALGRARL